MNLEDLLVEEEVHGEVSEKLDRQSHESVPKSPKMSC